MTVRRNKLQARHRISRRNRNRIASRRPQHETLEKRELLAAEILQTPNLIAVGANSGEQFSLNDQNLLSESPREIVLRFDGGPAIDGSTLEGIRFLAAGGDGSFENGSERIIPGFLGFEESRDDSGRVVVARFAETLADDQYVIQIPGFDDTQNDVVGLRNVNDALYVPSNPTDAARPFDEIQFEVEVGPRVLSVVPQPIEEVAGVRQQLGDTIHVYFNEDPLSNPQAGVITSNPGNPAANLPVVNPEFYKLIFTNDTVENTDDSYYVPDSVAYDPSLNRATLTYSDNLSDLAGSLGPGAVDFDGQGTYRLRIGSGSDAPVLRPSVVSVEGSEDTFAAAQDLGSFGGGTTSVVVTDGVIRNTADVRPQWPGAYDAAGNRDYRRDAALVGRVDTNTGINVFPYNFASLYGVNDQGIRVSNAITEAQEQRAREVLALYSERLGVQFVETDDSGLQIVTGDLRAIVDSADTGAGPDTPYSLYRVNAADPTRGVLILDAGENWFDGYGLSPDNTRPSWFVEAIRGIGSLLGIGNLFELPDGVGAGGSSPDEVNAAGVENPSAALPNLPSEPEFLSQSDVTLGQALHRPESDDVDFYQFTAAETGTVQIETFAQRLDDSSLLDTKLKLWRVTTVGGADAFELLSVNDDYFSNDSLIELQVEAGTRLMVGLSATGNDAYSGEVDGTAIGGRSEGHYELRVTYTSAAGNVLTDTSGTAIDGDADGTPGGDFNFWFRVAPETLSATQVGPRTIFVDKEGDDNFIGSVEQPLRTISAAVAQSREGDIIRLLPNGGVDGQITTPGDNLAYELGRGGTGNAVLRDGVELEVPRGVTVMVDAGAILKLQASKISVGSDAVDEDRSLAALQILGVPTLVEAGGTVTGNGEVVLTSYNDESIAVDTNALSTTPRQGDWAGIEFRNDVDRGEGQANWEAEGIFIDYVSHARIRYGGGSVAASAPVITPIQLRESRPTLIYNTIDFSSDAAISADPDSFEETNFHAPVFQRFAEFASDYSRVGPEISGNRLVDNSINGLFIRVETPAAGQLEPMTVSGRFDDTDIVHAINQVLVLQGQPGGPRLLQSRPSVSSTTVVPTTLPGGATGSLVDGEEYTYRVSFYTKEGSESLVSVPTQSVDATATGAILVQNLPAAPAEFVGRRLYRLDPATGDFVQAAELDRGSTSYVDDGSDRGLVLEADVRPTLAGVVASVFPEAGDLTNGRTYDYRMTYVDQFGGESLASNTTNSVVADANGSIFISGLPAAPEGFTGRLLYRVDPVSGRYLRVGQLGTDETTFLDLGGTIPGALVDEDEGSKLLPRFDARLTIDPGTVVKLQSSRIEAGFGADFYAEGRDGKEVVFTSRLDDSYGAGGTFDTNNDSDAGIPEPGDWAGLVFRQDSTASLDHADIQFGGGTSPINGQFTEFNAVEILQADVRIANSNLQNNASGHVNVSSRQGFGFNDESVIFVRGSQPVLVENTIVDNLGAAISINPDSLTAAPLVDFGRATGVVDLIATDRDNQGPLIAGNLIAGNSINGLQVRSEVLTTESVWDDTDIVHTVDGEIHSLTHHYNSGLRLRSDANQSLVVKFGSGATLRSDGRPLDIADRIGGTLQVIGTPGNPVVLTSLSDCSVGAGFTPEGRPGNDTENAGACTAEAGNPAAAGDWAGLQIGAYSNDRNVAYVIEGEKAVPASGITNAQVANAQVVGALAAGERSSDETKRLGFNIRGALASPEDVDVYQFTALGGTMVFFDIDDTSFGLDTVVELIDVGGSVVAGSDNSFLESSDPSLLNSGNGTATVLPLYQLGDRNVESPNALDAGMRVVLPGASDTDNTYFVRVRSAAEKTDGQYELSLRLRETDEVAGSTVQLADIRYATNAITVASAPLHSPLTGSATEQLDHGALFDPTPMLPGSGDEYVPESRGLGDSNVGNATTDNFATGDVLSLGNLLTTDRGSLVVSGQIGNVETTNVNLRLGDVDVFAVDLFAQEIESDVFDSENRYVSATFDVDYADGLGRPDTSLAVFNDRGQLILHGRDSNIFDDQGDPLSGVDSDKLDGGSAGEVDAYIGPVELPEGRYFVAVSSAASIPAVLNQYFEASAVSNQIRLAPINSVRNLVEDRLDIFQINDGNINFFGDSPFTPGVPQGNSYAAESPTISPAFDVDTQIDYSLDDIRLFITGSGIGGGNQSGIATFNPFTGTLERVLGGFRQGIADVAIRDDGELFSYVTSTAAGVQTNAANIGRFLNLSSVDASANDLGDDGIRLFRNNEAGTDIEADDGNLFFHTALAFPLTSLQNVNNNDGGVNNRTPANVNREFLSVGFRTTNGRASVIPRELSRNIVFLNSETAGETTTGGSREANRDRQFTGTFPYSVSDGPATDEQELGIIDTGNVIDPSGINGDGGDIQGIALDPNDRSSVPAFWALTDQGGVHFVDPSNPRASFSDDSGDSYDNILTTDFKGIVPIDPLHNPGFTWTGLTAGPQNIEGRAFRDVLFATTSDGWLYAFDATGETVEPANVFYNGKSAVALSNLTGAPVDNIQPTGLAFSTLETNPWHQTIDRRADPARGIEATFDASRLSGSGGQALYFGFEVDGNPANNTIERAEGDALGTLAPGGSHGSVVTRTFDLSQYSPADKPTVYFDYLLDIEDQDDFVPAVRQHNDSFRVFGSGDDGEWRLLTTTNDFRNVLSADEFDEFFRTDIPVQEVFDDSNGWRQARVDISPLAGSENVKLRFDFSTAGSMRTQAGAVDFVGVAGDRVEDRETFTLNAVRDMLTDESKSAVFENFVGQDLKVPAADSITLNSRFAVSGPTGNTIYRFVATGSAPGAVPPSEIAVEIAPGMSAEEVAEAIIEASPPTLRASADGGGLISFLAASGIVLDPDAEVGRAGPAVIEASDVARIRVPGGALLQHDESIDVAGTVVTFIAASTVTGPLAPGEVTFDPTDTPAAIAERIVAALPPEANAVADGLGNVILVDGTVPTLTPPAVSTTATPAAVSDTVPTLSIPDAADLTDGELVTITNTSGSVVLEFSLGGAAAGTSTATVIAYEAGDTAATIAQTVLDALTPEFRATLTATDGDLEFHNSATVVIDDAASLITLAGPAAVTDNLIELVPVAGDILPHGETLDITFGGASLNLRLVQAGRPAPSSAATSVLFNRTDTAADIAEAILAALPAGVQAYLNATGDGVLIPASLDVGGVATPVLVTPGSGLSALQLGETDFRRTVTPLTLPSAARLVDGEQFSVSDLTGQTRSFQLVLDSSATGAANEILYSAGDTGAEVAAKVAAALPADLQATISPSNPREILLAGATRGVAAAGSSVVLGGGSVAGAQPVVIDSTMLPREVAERLQIAFAESLGRFGTIDDISRATPDNYKIYAGDRIRLFDFVLDPSDSGPYGYSGRSTVSVFGDASQVGTNTPVPGDSFGESVALGYFSSQVRVNGASNNVVEGVYIDDLIVGFAERGEMVLNAPANQNFVVNPEFIPDDLSSGLGLSGQPERENTTLLGGYALEIRTSDTYGVPEDSDPTNLHLDEQVGLGRSFNTNDRLADGSVSLIAPAGVDLTDEDWFTLSDGTNRLAFEFDSASGGEVTPGRIRIPFDPTEVDGGFTASAIRDAINSPQAREVLDIVASTGDGGESNGSASTRIELFGSSTISVNAGAGRFMKVDLAASETYLGRESVRQISVVDHDRQQVEDVFFTNALSRTLPTEFRSSANDVLVAVGKIGDQVATGDNVGEGATAFDTDPSRDFDGVRIFMEDQDWIEIDIDTIDWSRGAINLTNPIISVYNPDDANGATAESITPLARSPESSAPGEFSAPGESSPGAFLRFQANYTGYYDIVVSSAAPIEDGALPASGEYSMTIRPDTRFTTDIPQRDVLMVDYQFGSGDANRLAEQGQLIIAGNQISFSADAGIRAVSTVDPISGLPLPGSPQLLRNQNSDDLVTGVVIANNVIANSGDFGIDFQSGTDANGSVTAANVFSRIVNNTVVNVSGGIGINLAGKVSPTILNNIVAGFDTGIDLANNHSGEVVLGGNAYQSNGNPLDPNLTLASSSNVIDASTPLFQDPDRGIYIPASGSIVIDSSFASLPDRAGFLQTVKQPAGIAPSPIIAPEFDALGQPRVDDPSVTTPGGVGSNVFVDRGAIDRADSTRPIAVLTTPQDAVNFIVDGGDGDADESFVRLSTGTVEFFEIQLRDESGTGLDPSTITAQSVLLTENGRTLQPDVDFTFGYSANSRTVRLTPLAGLWRSDAVYEITLNNTNGRISYQATSGDRIADGDRLVLVDANGLESSFEFDAGYALQAPQTFGLLINGTGSDFVDRDTIDITAPGGNRLRLEINRTGSTDGGNIAVDLSSAGTVREVRDAFLAALGGNLADGTPIVDFLDLSPVGIGENRVQLGVTVGHTVTAPAENGFALEGTDTGIVAGQTFTYRRGATAVTFEFADALGTVASGNTAIRIERTDTPDQIAAAIGSALAGAGLGLGGARAIGDGTVLVGGEVGDALDVDGSQLSLVGTPGVTGSLALAVPTDRVGSDFSGTEFRINSGSLQETFEFTNDPAASSPNRLIVVDAAADATAIAVAMAAAIGGAFPDSADPTSDGNVVTLGETSEVTASGLAEFTSIDTLASGLVASGVSGGAVAVPFVPSAQASEIVIAASLQNAINKSSSAATSFSPGGGTLLLSDATEIRQVLADGSTSVVGVAIPAVADLAGNPVRETRINDETRFTVIMPDVVFDLGDAPDSYGTLFESNGARHALVGATVPSLGSNIDTETNGQPGGEGDDATVNVSASSTGTRITATQTAADPNSVTVTLNAVAVSSGDVLDLVIDGNSTEYELVDGSSNPGSNRTPVFFALGDDAAAIATRLRTAIANDLRGTGGNVRVVADPADPAVFRIESIDDEDGLGTGTFTGIGLDGNPRTFNVFAGPNLQDAVLAREEVFGYLNPLDPAGANVNVSVVGSGLLNAWIDYDENGTFEPDELVIDNVPVVDGNNTLTIPQPSNVGGNRDFDTWMRLRVSEFGNVGPTGVAVGGEVEDYAVSVIPRALPEPVADTYAGVEDTVLTVNAAADGVLNNDTNVTNQLLPTRFFIVDQASHGTVEVIDPIAGTFRYTPDADYYGEDTFTYRLSTQQNASADADNATVATVTIDLAPVNDAPRPANDLRFYALEDSFVDVPAADLLAGAVAHAGAGMLAEAVNQRPFDESVQNLGVVRIAFGTSTIDANNWMTSTIATTNGTVGATFETQAEADARQVGATPQLVSLRFTPDADFNRDNLSTGGVALIDELEFTITDDGFLESAANPNQDPPVGTTGTPQQASATVTFEVLPQNDTPAVGSERVGITNPAFVAAHPGVIPTEDTALVISGDFLLANDHPGIVGTQDDEVQAIGGNDGPLRITAVRLVDDTQGTITLRSDGTIEFTPADDLYGEVEFEYDVVDQGVDVTRDGAGDFIRTANPLSATATSTIFIEPVNDAPVAFDRRFSLAEPDESNAPREFAITPAMLIGGNSSPASGIVVDASSVTLPATGAAIVDGSTLLITDADGRRSVIEFSTTSDPSVGSDRVVQFTAGDTGDAIAARLVTALVELGFGGVADTNRVDVSMHGTLAIGELPSVAGDFDDLLGAPLDESEQALRVVEFSATVDGVTTTVDGATLAAGVVTETLATAAGVLTLEFNDGVFTAGTYQPADDYNERTPFQPTDSFTYRIADDGQTTILQPAEQRTLAAQRSVESATVTLTVTQTNDPPVFTIAGTNNAIDILEIDLGDPATVTVAGFIASVAPGPATALDELQRQDVTFAIDLDASTVPAGLMTAAPTIDSNGALVISPTPDAFGEATYVVVATDNDPDNPRSTELAFTVNVRPVNDAPRFAAIDPSIPRGTTPDPNDFEDNGFAVAPDNDGDGFVEDGSITYFLREDNTTAIGDPASPAFFIPLRRDATAGGFQQIGLLDVIAVGPTNETLAVDGGSQNVSLSQIGTQTDLDQPMPTSLGGTLQGVRDAAGELIGFNYTPRADYNRLQGAPDSFVYTVIDASPTAGESFELGNGFVADRRATQNTVFLDLSPVNDRPEFTLREVARPGMPGTSAYIESPEDGARSVIGGFAFDIAAGPRLSAFDENDFVNGQNVQFTVTPVGITAAEVAQLFDEVPTISESGTLSYQPAANVFGEFTFEVVLTDDGDDDPARGNLQTSLPQTMTIDIQPVNDPPQLDPASEPIEYSIVEDQRAVAAGHAIEIPVNGDGTNVGLLDVFDVGPANEASALPLGQGGSQSVGILFPTPTSTAAGGTLEPVFDSTGTLVSLRYTPRADFNGTDTFIYTVTDDGQTVAIDANNVGTSDPRIASNQVSINVSPVNDRPQFSGAADVIVDEDQGVVTLGAWADNVQAGPATAVDELGLLNGSVAQGLAFEITRQTDNLAFDQFPTVTIVDGVATLEFETAMDSNGVDTFVVQLRDDGPNDLANGDQFISDPLTFTIRVRPTNDPPTFTPGPAVSVSEDSGSFRRVWATDLLPGPQDEVDAGQEAGFRVNTPAIYQPLFASLPQIDADGFLSFVPAANAVGVALVEVVAFDSDGAESMPVTLRIEIGEVNDVPVAVADGFSVTEDAARTLRSEELLGNDIDPDFGVNGTNPNEVLSVVLPDVLTTSAGALVTFNPDTGELVYDPTNSPVLQSLPEGQTTLDTFSYQVRDAAGALSASAVVTMTVTGVNDAPSLQPDFPVFNAGGPTTFDPLANDNDIDRDDGPGGLIDPASIQIVNQPAFGAVEVLADGRIQYRPFGSFAGTDEFTYTVADNLPPEFVDGVLVERAARSQPITVRIAANAPPAANFDSATTIRDQAVDINVAGNDTDANDNLNLGSVEIIDSPSRGNAFIISDGQIRYVPQADFLGTDTFTYRISDADGLQSNLATVSVRVIASPEQNQANNEDVNADGFVTPLDALLVINRLAAGGTGSIPVEGANADFLPNHYDVNGDLFITPSDALAVINQISLDNAPGSGEFLVPLPVERIERISVAPAESTNPFDAVLVDPEKLVLASPGVDDDSVVDLLADRGGDDDDDKTEAVDAAFAKLL